MSTAPSDLVIRFCSPHDVPTILHFIRALARYEKLESQVVADEAKLHATLFGARPAAEVLLAELAGKPIGFALFFASYSTFLAQPGLYLEDLFVEPEARGRGVGIALMSALARITRDRGWGRFEWAVLDWNKPSLDFYAALGAVPQSSWIVHRIVEAPLTALAEVWPGAIAAHAAAR
jgi:GNAT superfamily N-acetyltransferase